jgi:hypothetical protein
VERWEWLASTDSAERRREFYRKYRGRTNSIWKSEYAELNPENWTEPLFSLNVNTRQPSPFQNAIHLRNSKDGTSIDHIYFAPKIFMRPPSVLNFDAYFPTFNTTNFPNGSYFSMGFEVNSGGYIGSMFEFQVWSDGTTVHARLRAVEVRDGVSNESVSADFASSVTQAAWESYKLMLLPNRMELHKYAGSWPLTKIASLDIPFDIQAAVTPYFANETDTAVVSNVYIGQFQAYEVKQYKGVRNVINVSSIAAGGYADSGVLILPEECAVSVNVTYGSTATAGVRVYILAANDQAAATIDAENTTDAFAYFEPSFAAGATRQRTVNLDSLPKYCKILVRNLDGSVATGAVKVYVHEVF